MRPSRQPAHTRTLTVRLAPAGRDRIAVDARLLDVRKRGVVEVAGRLNGPGVVHDMRLALGVTPGGERIVDARLEMASVPFPGGPRTGGEGCRDNEAGASGLVGLPLGQGFLTGLQRVMGSVRGCFHVFTLMRLVAATSARAFADADAVRGSFARTLAVDATWTGEGLELQGMLTDVAVVLGEGTERQRASFEVEAVLDATLPELSVANLRVAYRGKDDAGAEEWSDSGLERISGLVGQSLARGFAPTLGEGVAARGPLAPVYDLLLMMQPVAFQAMPALPVLGETGEGPPPRRPPAARDSCAMWRQDGPLVRTLEEEARARTD